MGFLCTLLTIFVNVFVEQAQQKWRTQKAAGGAKQAFLAIRHREFKQAARAETHGRIDRLYAADDEIDRLYTAEHTACPTENKSSSVHHSRRL